MKSSSTLADLPLQNELGATARNKSTNGDRVLPCKNYEVYMRQLAVSLFGAVASPLRFAVITALLAFTTLPLLAQEQTIPAELSFLNKIPRPQNLWVFLAQTAAPTCSAAPVTNSFSRITRRRCRSLFPGGFFSARFIVSPLRHPLIYLPTALRASLGSFASEPLSNGRSECSLAIGSVMLRTTRSAPSVG